MSSMTLALLASIAENKKIDLVDIMNRFVSWLREGEYTPFGQAFDVGGCTYDSIKRYMKDGNIDTCGGRKDIDNGNGSLMRIMPACLYCATKLQTIAEVDVSLAEIAAIEIIHKVSGLTHNHLRAKIACGLYFFMTKEIIGGSGSLKDRLQTGLDVGFKAYESWNGQYSDGTAETPGEIREELGYYKRLRNLDNLSQLPSDDIRSSGYVVDSIEAAVWSLITTESFKECELKAVNLGGDTDTIGAIAGGLAGLYYGYDNIPEEWLKAVQRRGWIEAMIQKTDVLDARP